ncbi:hypothetical protein [Aquibium sp. ELW1220]|uniref:hypothetical protein n=1 Tax=Aquibium sp. ELW1220 TaxID=2976766 RepID=UPI0025B07F00|nr:hypothetical protein [Aquibium sp. ELW1220]MDN2580263.1 hypothetical protein [Aquibium sp. ELW1220]
MAGAPGNGRRLLHLVTPSGPARSAVSCVAGLTALSLWRFALATRLGVIPISFLFAFFGDEFVLGGPAGMIAIAAPIGGMTLLPIGLRLLWSRYRR